MRNFGYSRPLDVAEAIGIEQRQADTKYLGGGTNLVDLMKMGVERPSHLVDITRLPLARIEERNGGVSIGAMVRNSEVAAHPAVRQRYPVLSQAILSGASAQIRNMALEVKGMFDNFDDLDFYFLHDVRFHDQVIQASGNRFLIHIDYSLSNYLFEFRVRTSKNVTRSTIESNAEAHQVILESIRKRKAESAEKLMYEHLQKAAELSRTLEASRSRHTE